MKRYFGIKPKEEKLVAMVVDRMTNQLEKLEAAKAA